MRLQIGNRRESIVDTRYAIGAELKQLTERLGQLEKYAL